jgi:hypothetical protein
MSGLSIEATFELWASSLRGVKITVTVHSIVADLCFERCVRLGASSCIF